MITQIRLEHSDAVGWLKGLFSLSHSVDFLRIRGTSNSDLSIKSFKVRVQATVSVPPTISLHWHIACGLIARYILLDVDMFIVSIIFATPIHELWLAVVIKCVYNVVAAHAFQHGCGYFL